MEEQPALVRERCVACCRDAPRVSDGDIVELQRQIPEWSVRDQDGIPRLERTFRFKEYRRALDFTQRIGDLAEAEDHHPAILTEARRVTVTWWTHAIRGLHRNDFIMAAKTDGLYDASLDRS